MMGWLNQVTYLNVLITLFIVSTNGECQTKPEHRLLEVENKVSEVYDKYTELEGKLEATAEINAQILNELKLQQAESRRKDDVIRLLQQQVGDLQTKVERVERTLTSVLESNKVDVFQGLNGSAVLNHPARYLLDQGEAVAFHAVVNANGEVRNLGVNQPILFDTVLLNINGAYNKQHGNFVAPTAGLYIFSTSVLDAASQPLIHAELVKNGAVLARAYGHANGGFPEQGSVTVVTQLQAGDDVFVRISCCGNIAITGMKYTSFTGALLMYI